MANPLVPSSSAANMYKHLKPVEQIISWVYSFVVGSWGHGVCPHLIHIFWSWAVERLILAVMWWYEVMQKTDQKTGRIVEGSTKREALWDQKETTCWINNLHQDQGIQGIQMSDPFIFFQISVTGLCVSVICFRLFYTAQCLKKPNSFSCLDLDG